MESSLLVVILDLHSVKLVHFSVRYDFGERCKRLNGFRCFGVVLLCMHHPCGGHCVESENSSSFCESLHVVDCCFGFCNYKSLIRCPFIAIKRYDLIVNSTELDKKAITFKLGFGLKCMQFEPSEF